jgi:hypothetical protein
MLSVHQNIRLLEYEMSFDRQAMALKGLQVYFCQMGV